MDPQIESAQHWFRQIYLTGIPELLNKNETSFLSFLCCVAAIDALAGYRYTNDEVRVRFESFIRNYFSASYTPHAANLYLFRCRMLHNFSPAYFSLIHKAPTQHLNPSQMGDTILSDDVFFNDMRDASDRYFADLNANPQLQNDMLARLQNIQVGGSIYVA